MVEMLSLQALITQLSIMRRQLNMQNGVQICYQLGSVGREPYTQIKHSAFHLHEFDFYLFYYA